MSAGGDELRTILANLLDAKLEPIVKQVDRNSASLSLAVEEMRTANKNYVSVVRKLDRLTKRIEKLEAGCVQCGYSTKKG